MSAPRVAVIGAGISGLAAAHRLLTAPTEGERPQVIVLEARERVGGVIQTGHFAGSAVDLGPDSLLARVPWAVELCGQIGLADELVAVAADQAHVWARRRLRPLPSGLMSGLPDGGRALARSGILGPLGVARAALDGVVPRRALSPENDESIASLLGRRFGRQVVERLADPLLGGIYAGDVRQLGVAAAAPALAAARALPRGGLASALRAGAPQPSDDPLFVAPRGGLERLPERLAASLPGAEVRLGAHVAAIEPAGRGMELVLADGAHLTVDAAVLAVPAHSAARILDTSAAATAVSLRAIAHASVAVVMLAFERDELASLPVGSGFLVPRSAGATITACSWSTAKWPRPSEDDLEILRCSVGRAADRQALTRSDDELVALVTHDLQRLGGVRATPSEARIVRWRDALPQYSVDHFGRVERIQQGLAHMPMLELAGAAYEGIGIASCIRCAWGASDRLLARLSAAALAGSSQQSTTRSTT